MSQIVIPQRRVWTRQPQRPVKLIARGLSSDVVFAAIAGQPESISGVFPVPIGSSSLTVLDQGRGLYSPSTTVGGWSWPVSPSHPIYSITTQHTIVVFGRLDSIALYGNIFGVPHASTWVAPYYAMGISGNSPATTLAAAASVTVPLNAPLNVASIASGLVTGQETSFAVTRNGTSGAYYRGGALFGSLTWADDGAINFVNKRPPVLFNRSSSSNGEGAQGAASAVLVFNRALSADEIARVVENPWQIFVRRDRYAFVSLGGGGTSSVYSDSALSYYIRSLLSSDSGITYAIRNAIYQDDAVGYYLRASVAQNDAVGYVLRAAIAKDATAAYLMRGLVQTDDSEAYSLRGLVQTSDNEAYIVRSAVSADTAAVYDVLSSSSVASNSSVSYNVRGSVTANSSPSYAVRSATQSDQVIGYSLRSSVSRDLVSAYGVAASESSVYSDLAASYSVDVVTPACPTAESIAAAVLAAMQASPPPTNTVAVQGDATIKPWPTAIQIATLTNALK